MIEHPPNGRAFFISKHELEGNNSDFLWSCYCRFKNQIKPKKDAELVLIWKEDFNELYNNYHPKLMKP